MRCLFLLGPGGVYGSFSEQSRAEACGDPRLHSGAGEKSEEVGMVEKTEDNDKKVVPLGGRARW